MAFGLFGGKDVGITIDVEDGDRTFRPGDTVNVRIGLSSSKGVKAREVRAGLVLHHRYQEIERATRTNRDSGPEYSKTWKTSEDWLHRESLLGVGGAEGSLERGYQFSWPLPLNGPAPCNGEIAKIRYLVKVTVDRRLARDINEERELAVAIAPPGEWAQPGEYGEPANADDALLKLRLPGLELVRGQTIKGQLLVEPMKQFDARGVRVELVRLEIVPGGDQVNRHEKVEQRVDLAAGLTLQPGVAQSYDFQLSVPESAQPSHQTQHSQLTWVIRGTVDRAMRGDPGVSQTVLVYNPPPD
jgi:hypothetical protein